MTSIEIRTVHPAVGAEVLGLDPTRPLDAATRASLREAFDARGMLLLRGLDIDLAFQDTFSRMLIGDDRSAAEAGTIDKQAYFVSNVEENAGAPFGRLPYHCDLMWSSDAFQVLSLYGTQVEPGGATTTFTSATHAWKTLPADLRARVEPLHARHVNGLPRGSGADGVLRAVFDHEEATVFPIARPHPRTGETILYVSEMNTSDVVELAPAESEALLQELFAHLYDPDNVYEHEWQEGDLVVFDNLATQHARGEVPAHGPARTLRKVFAPMPAAISARPVYAGG
jgi:taurine dioxygenase